jgi:hypothetical protein
MTTTNYFYDFSSKDYNRITNNIKSFLDNPDVQKKIKSTHANPFNINPLLNLSLTAEIIQNPISKDKSPLLHADIVNSYLHLLNKTKSTSSPHHIFFTTDFIDQYDYKLNNIEKKESFTFTTENKLQYDRKKRLEHLALFLTGIRKKRPEIERYARQQLLDDVFDTINTYYNPSKKRKTSTTTSPPLIFFPIFLNENHFALAVLDIHKIDPCVTYYDSLLGIDITRTPIPMTEQAKKYLNLIVELLSNYFFNFKDETYRSRYPNTTHFFQNVTSLDIEQLDPPDMPQQPNVVDCGVYVCALAYLIANNLKIPTSFTDQQIQNIRLRIKQLIFSFSPDFPQDHDHDEPFTVTH